MDGGDPIPERIAKSHSDLALVNVQVLVCARYMAAMLGARDIRWKWENSAACFGEGHEAAKCVQEHYASRAGPRVAHSPSGPRG